MVIKCVTLLLLTLSLGCIQNSDESRSRRADVRPREQRVLVFTCIYIYVHTMCTRAYVGGSQLQFRDFLSSTTQYCNDRDTSCLSRERRFSFKSLNVVSRKFSSSYEYSRSGGKGKKGKGGKTTFKIS